MRANRAIVAVLVALPVVAGCLDQAPSSTTIAEPLPMLDDALLTLGDTVASGTQPLLWEGKKLSVGGQRSERTAFQIQLPEGYWDANMGLVEVSIRWPFDQPGRFSLQVVDASGGVVASGRSNSYASVALARELGSGSYEAIVTIQSGTGAYEGVIQMETQPRDAPAREVAPNLYALIPGELTLQWLLPSAPGGVLPTGCWPEETIEKQARRCLRVSSAVGNAGEGALQVHMMPVEGIKAVAGLGQYTQRVFKTDGTFREVPVGLGAFHPTHAHFHYDGLAQFMVYKYDLEKDQRLDPVSKARKNGFCFVDMGLVKLGLPGTVYSGNHESACLLPSQTKGWITGISANWYDLYWNSLSDQYVDIHGVPDGIYELVFTVNADKTLVETDPSDNEASLIFELKGDTVKPLRPGRGTP